jgi:SsrA-binding protein
MVIQNKKVRFDYEILEEYVCGIVLTGVEVKELRNGKVNIIDGFCYIKDDEVYVKNVVFTTGLGGRDIKLLLRKKEINNIQKKLIKGLTIVPYKIFKSERGLFKMTIIIGRGKKLFNKRETIKKRDQEREMLKNVKK